MENIAPRNRDFEVDLENGDIVCDDNPSKSPILGVKKQAKMLLAKVYGGFVDGPEVNFSVKAPNTDRSSAENVKVVKSMNLEGKENKGAEERKIVKEQHRKSSNKKSPKPPRPPRAPSLDAADQKLIREIAELARLRRAKIERMKAMKKMKATKSSSSNSNIFALLFTFIFCLVIIFQGMSSKATPVSFQGSPVPAGAGEDGLISVQYSVNPSASDPNGPNSGYSNLVKQVADLHPQQKLKFAV